MIPMVVTGDILEGYRQYTQRKFPSCRDVITLGCPRRGVYFTYQVGSTLWDELLWFYDRNNSGQGQRRPFRL